MQVRFKFCVLAVAALAAVSCEKDDGTAEVNAPVLSVSSGVTAYSEGGTYVFSYSVTDPVEGGAVYCSGNASWLSNFDTSTYGLVKFEVAEYRDGDLRSGNISVFYVYNDSYVIKKVGVIQISAEGPSVSLDSDVVTATYDGGSFWFGYTVENPSENGALSCKTDVKWISDLDWSEDGVVRFTAAANDTGELRTGHITLTYTYNSSKISLTTDIVQDHVGTGAGFRGTLEDLVGTYQASGLAYYSEAHCEQTTWTMKIYQNGDNGIVIDGIVPEAAGWYKTISAYAPKAFLNYTGQIVVPTQFPDYYEVLDHYMYYIGWTPCISYEDGVGFGYSKDRPDCTFTYDADTEVWTSDYGMFFGLFTDDGIISSFYSFYDVVAPGFSMKKTSSSTKALSTDESSEVLTPLQPHGEFSSK